KAAPELGGQDVHEHDRSDLPYAAPGGVDPHVRAGAVGVQCGIAIQTAKGPDHEHHEQDQHRAATDDDPRLAQDLPDVDPCAAALTDRPTGDRHEVADHHQPLPDRPDDLVHRFTPRRLA